jgi:ElaA protein
VVEVRSAVFDELDVHVLYAILKLRVDVFVVEQNCVYPELDGLDQQARHFWIDDGDGPTAYLRVNESDREARIGRVVVHPSERGAGLAAAVMDAALTSIGDGRPVVLDAQVYAKDFYVRRGFVPAGPEFLEDGIPHLPMRRPLPPS